MPCNSVVFQGRKEKFGKLRYFDMYLSKKLSIFKIQGFYDVIICIMERPCNFAIFEGRSSKFCKL